jgi:hypothetical protein
LINVDPTEFGRLVTISLWGLIPSFALNLAQSIGHDR